MQLVDFGNLGLGRLSCTTTKSVLPLGSSVSLGLDGIQVIFLLGVIFRFRLHIVRHFLQVLSVEAKVRRVEAYTYWAYGTRAIALCSHLLPCLVVMPLLPRFLPGDESVDLLDSLFLVQNAATDTAFEQCINIKGSVLGSVAEELEDSFDPAHKLCEETIIVCVDFVDEFVKVVLVPLA